MIGDLPRSYGNPTQGLLNTDELNKLKLYAEESLVNNVQKTVMYYRRMNPTEKVGVVVTYAGTNLLSIVAGGVLGYGIGSGLGKLAGFFCTNEADSDTATDLGAKIGTLVGMVGGLVVGSYGNQIKFMSSKKYTKWLEDIKKEELGKVYEKILTDDPRFDPFICKITHTLIAVPVTSPDGQVYEKEAITNWIEARWDAIQVAHESGMHVDGIEKLHTTVNPIRGQPFQEKDLKINNEYLPALEELIIQKSSELEDVEERRLFAIASELILSDLRENRKIILNMQIGNIYSFVRDKKLPLSIGDIVTKRLEKEFADV